MAVPNVFANATGSIPLSQLDANFNTAITIGNTAVYLGNTTTTLGNVTLTNATISSSSIPLPQGYLYGCILSNNSSDATNDIDIAAGVCRDSTNAANITVSALTKRLDANWAAGTNQGMRYSGAAIADTTYHIYAVSTASGTQDIYADPSASATTALTHLQAETGGSSYIYARRIGSIIRASGTILSFVQDGDVFQLSLSVKDIDSTGSTNTAVSATLSSVPTGIRVKALFRGFVGNSAGRNNGVLFSDLSVTDQAPSTSVAAPGESIATFQTTNITTVNWGGDFGVFTNTSAQIRYRRDTNADASTQVGIITYGWIDSRGRDS